MVVTPKEAPAVLAWWTFTPMNAAMAPLTTPVITWCAVWARFVGTPMGRHEDLDAGSPVPSQGAPRDPVSVARSRPRISCGLAGRMVG